MARSEIPAAWRRRVCAVLKDGTYGKQIVWTGTAAQRFESDSFGAWPRDGIDAIIAFLSTESPLGCLVSMGYPPGVTYEFIFPFEGRSFYGKLLLPKDDQKTVLILSVHLPRDLTLRCD